MAVGTPGGPCGGGRVRAELIAYAAIVRWGRDIWLPMR